MVIRNPAAFFKAVNNRATKRAMEKLVKQSSKLLTIALGTVGATVAVDGILYNTWPKYKSSRSDAFDNMMYWCNILYPWLLVLAIIGLITLGVLCPASIPLVITLVIALLELLMSNFKKRTTTA